MDEWVGKKVYHVDTGPGDVGRVVRDTGEGLVVEFPGCAPEEFEYGDIRSADR